jgi:hypothetical protein
MRSPFFSEALQFVAFADAGIVWNRPKETFRIADVRVTPGLGIRVRSPVGPLRVDVAYNQHQFPIGSVYLVGSKDEPLRCVSRRTGPENTALAPGESCPATFSPRQGRSFLSRLTLQYSIGEAF